jgi:dihydroxyacetone kinase-like protein
MATAIVEDLPFESGDKVLAFVNGMGGTPLIELYIVFRELHRFLGDLEFAGGDGVLAFVNGMGGTPLIELYLMYGEVATLLEKAGVQVARTLVGNYITSLDMAGASVTVHKADDELIRLWDAPVETAGLRWGV